jgi:TrmH family RNA methyltransferase
VTRLVSSPANPVAKRMRRLASRRYRQLEDAAVVHGVQPVFQAVQAGTRIEELITAPDLLRAPAARDLVVGQAERGVPVTEMTAELFTRLSDRDGPGGLAAIVRPRTYQPADLATGALGALVVLDRIANPGNLGTILRTVNATGAGGVLLVGPTCDPFDPQAIKASMGTVFSVPVARLADLAAFFGWAGSQGLPVATTSRHGRDPLWTAEYPDRLAVLFGAEGPGLDASTLRRGDLQLAVPMVGTAESLNVAVTVAVLLYEVWRRRG